MIGASLDIGFGNYADNKLTIIIRVIYIALMTFRYVVGHCPANLVFSTVHTLQSLKSEPKECGVKTSLG